MKVTHSSAFAITLISFTAVSFVSANLQIRQAEPSPTGLGECIFQAGAWSCELSPAATVAQTSLVPASTTTLQSSSSISATTSIQAPAEPSPTGQGACEAHGDHWHCEGSSEANHEGHDHEGHDHEGHDHEESSHDGHEGHSHAGHSHGPSAEFGCGLAPLEDYNLGLHIAAFFILLVASVAGVTIAFVGAWTHRGDNTSSKSSKSARVSFAMRYFGGGIILSTAFIHLLFHAFVYFSNECIGALAYEAASPAIAMGAVYVVFLLDFFVLRPYRRRAMQIDETYAHAKQESMQGANESYDKNTNSEEDVTLEQGKDANAKLQKCNVLALEAGIIFHSIIIGVTIGTASGAGWVPLLIAITFHQFCEGIGLASRISLLPKASTPALEKILMCFAFCMTTPIGIAIGIGVRQSFNTNGRGTLLAIGILDSISAGILLYSSLVQILVGDFIHNKDMLNASKATCLAALFWFTVGAIIMSVLGVWA